MKSQPTTGRLTDRMRHNRGTIIKQMPTKELQRMVPMAYMQWPYMRKGGQQSYCLTFSESARRRLIWNCDRNVPRQQQRMTKCKKPCCTMPTVIRHRCLVTSDNATGIPTLDYQVVSRHHQAQVPYVIYMIRRLTCAQYSTVWGTAAAPRSLRCYWPYMMDAYSQYANV